MKKQVKVVKAIIENESSEILCDVRSILMQRGKMLIKLAKELNFIFIITWFEVTLY